MLRRILVAVVEGVVAWLICVIVGTLLVTIGDPAWVPAIGALLKTYAALVGLLVALYVFAVGDTGSWVWPGRRPQWYNSHKLFSSFFVLTYIP